MEASDYIDKIHSLMVGYKLGDMFVSVYNEYETQFNMFPAAIKHHHAEVGGYARHIYEVMYLCESMVGNCDIENIDIIALMKAAFLHDLDKLERYEIDPEPPTITQTKYAISLGITVSPNESKSSISVKIDNMKTGANNAIQYCRYKDQLTANDSALVAVICSKLDIQYDRKLAHCISFHHGGWSDIKGKMSPEATLLHCADLISANIKGV